MTVPVTRCYAAVLAASLLAAGGWSRSPLQLPSFDVPIDNRTVSLHRDVTLACVVNHLGKHQVAWLHLDRQSLISISDRLITQLSQFSVHHDRHKTWMLKIRNVKREDGGVYMCQVNTEPMLMQKGFVTVVVPPNIIDSRSSSSEVSVSEGANVRLKCHADGQPKPAISWKRADGLPLFTNRPGRRQNGTALRLLKVTRRSTGAYLCIANNGVAPSPSKMITLKVEFPPSVQVETQLYGVPLGSAVTMSCHTEAQPRAINYWTYGSNILLHTPNKFHIEQLVDGFKTTMRLTVHNLRQSDFDVYRCVSKNSLGEAEGSIRIYEATPSVERPRTTPPRPQSDRRPPRPQHNQDHHTDSTDAQLGIIPEDPTMEGSSSKASEPAAPPAALVATWAALLLVSLPGRR